MKQGYRTIRRAGMAEWVVQKSRFIGRSFPVTEEETARELLGRVQKQHYDATHNCYAYRLGEQGEIARYSDDGEPGGTAGLPILEVIRQLDVTNLLVVVTRYFGGVLLGTGGLVRAYGKSAKLALEAGEPISMLPAVSMALDLSYRHWAQLEERIRALGVLEELEFTELVNVQILLPKEREETFLQRIADWTDGQTIPVRGEERLMPFK